MHYIFIIILFVFTMFILHNKNRTIEGFEYNRCINSGFTKEFCLQTPTSQFGPASCLCPNGSLGYRIPGYRGKCICNISSYPIEYNPVYSYDSISFL